MSVIYTAYIICYHLHT